MYKKLLLCVATIALSTNILHGMDRRNPDNLKKNSPFTSKFPNIKLPLGIKAALKGGKNGAIAAFLVALPSIGLLDSSLKEKLALPFLSALAGGIFGTVTGGISTFFSTGHEESFTHQTAVDFRARGTGAGFGALAGIAALTFCYAANKSGTFNVFNP
jgi:hypothetical protein